MARAKRKNKVALRTMSDAFLGPEPSFAYDHKLNRLEYMGALNWYAATLTREESKDYVTAFLKAQKNKSFLKQVQKVPHAYFTPTYGAIARMLSNDFLIPETGPKWLDKNLNNLIAEYTPVVDEVKEKKKKAAPVVDVQARTAARARSIAGGIDDIFEDEVWFRNSKLEANTIYNYLLTKNVSGLVAGKVAELFGPHLDELKSIKKDEQLKEAYSVYTPKDIKRFIEFYQNVVDTCLTFSENQKKAKVRKPRAKKAVSVEKKVGGLKYLKLYTPFQLASINPSKILGATQLWLFDTRYTKLTMLNALDRGGIDIKGQSFKNVDTKTSCTKKIGRKTKEVINAVLKSSKPQCRKALENVTAKPGKLQLRSNARIVFVRVF